MESFESKIVTTGVGKEEQQRREDLLEEYRILSDENDPDEDETHFIAKMGTATGIFSVEAVSSTTTRLALGGIDGCSGVVALVESHDGDRVARCSHYQMVAPEQWLFNPEQNPEAMNHGADLKELLDMISGFDGSKFKKTVVIFLPATEFDSDISQARFESIVNKSREILGRDTAIERESYMADRQNPSNGLIVIRIPAKSRGDVSFSTWEKEKVIKIGENND